MTSMKAIIWLVALCIATPASAEIYKWFDDQGRVHFSDKPSRQHASATIKVKINSYTNATISTLDPNDKQNEGKPASSRKVIMYSTSWCGYCKKARNYFKANNIPFIDHDIESDRKAKQAYDKLNGRGIPVILFGNKRMNGFTVAGFKRIYQI